MEAVKELAIQFFKGAVEKTEKTLSFVPQDKLNWKPSPTSRSALEVGAHIAVVIASMAPLYENRQSEPISIQDLFKHLTAEEAKYTSLDSVLALLHSGSARMIKALESIPASELESGTIKTPFGERPLKRFIFVPESHTYEHAAQIDFLQTIWGDNEFH